jgi:hypothetical protein
MTDLPFDPLELLRSGSGSLNIPGGLLTRKGAQPYVGCVPAIAGTLFFADAHLPAMRDAIKVCFEDYIAIAQPNLTWLFREDPPEGPSKQVFAKARPLASMLTDMDKDNALSFCYTSGKEAHDAGPWEFQIFGLPAWRAEMGDWGLCGIRFSVPLLFVEETPGVFRDMFVAFAKRLRAVHGYAGYSLIRSALRDLENQAFEAFLTSKFRGFDAGNLIPGATNAHLGIKTVSWLTAINHTFLEKVGGEGTLRSELPSDWFGAFDYGSGVVIQAGPRPEAAPVDAALPALLALPNMFLRNVRVPKARLHYASANNEPNLIGWAAEQWLKRLDVDPDQLLEFRARLLKEPKL